MNDFIVKFAVPISQIALMGAAFIFLRSTIRMRKSTGKTCPKCSQPLPASRLPKNLYEVVLGGWTCPHCKTKLTYDLKVRD